MADSSPSSRSRKPGGPTLRQQAEQKLQDQPAPAAPPPSETDLRALQHELQVHEVELKMQNEELVESQATAQLAADRYTELFDFAPIGLFVLDLGGLIVEINLAGAALLASERQALLGRPFDHFLHCPRPEDRVDFNHFRCSLQADEGRRTCEARLLRPHYRYADVHIEGVRIKDDLCQLAVTDVTELKRAGEALRQANAALASGSEQLRLRNDELERFNRAMVSRELRMIEMKKEVNDFCANAGLPLRYPAFPGETKTDPLPPSPPPT